MAGQTHSYHGHFKRYALKHIGIGMVLGAIAGITWKYTVLEPRKQAYADFYKTYDVNKEAERMKKAGIFQGELP